MCGIDRRRVLTSGLALLGTLRFHALFAANASDGGCSLTLDMSQAAPGSRGIGIVGNDLQFSTGDPDKDRMLGRALVRMSQLFGERPGFGFIDDADSPNAYASPPESPTGPPLVPGTWGTVRFGSTLFRDLQSKFDDDGIAILAVIAHEFAHISQYRRKVIETLNGGQKTKRRAELHADLVAGYYLGTRKIANGSIKLRSAGLALYSIGDYSFNNREHHGTPEQRVEAAEHGYSFAQNGLAYDDAFDRGMNWVLDRYAS